ncbi:hypothetical protein DZF91_14480 [Actinomadura logoneensis]|uniref:Carboxypeptidase regulatory-like domain-containing protein n=1 Tax=Actinomadura logoneensis TaxID=2293572 RepID=A0A372JLS1_9ACTN|nr:hypothetical protein [Actinomadura logoneensis]RFU40961.1 hypothetical protein DZF91_14480 [Actinomadura logoneensis]
MNEEPFLDELRAAFQRMDPVPDDVLAAGRSALSWREPSADLAELTDESERELAGVRGSSGLRLLTFRAPGHTVEVEISGVGSELAMTGRLAPATVADVRLRHPHAVELSARADERGRFVLTDVPKGLVSLVFCLPDASCVVTSWILL